jgi:hypothetical protein
MHSREAAEAPAQAPDTGADDAQQHEGQSNAMVTHALDQLTELAALSWSVTTGYTEQIKLTGQTAKAEWRLSGRSLAIAVVLLVFFGAGSILLWGSILLLLGYILAQATASVAITATAMLLLQFAMLCWCWRSLKYVLTQVGFSQTWQQLQRVLQQNGDNGEHDAD